MITVQQVGEEDWARLKEVRLHALSDSPDAFGSSITRERGFQESHWRMRLRASSWWLAGVDDTADGVQDVGLVCAIQEPGAPPEERHVVSMWVAPAHRRRGVGGALLRALLKGCADDGAQTVTLWVVDGNAAAAQLYRRHGFEPTGARMALGRDPSRTEERWQRTLGVPA